ncbi:hypothetical protein IB260_00410 [Pseudomonas sp. PDM23]|uniref:hypothetical protein n=1 Tax=Pseudomonas sp. PDM23 TaxID=2769275 RepID=UPI0017821E1D|nr:hypothetical protein [Pseudomonas sp. PDM23]MBD9573756.1 hypothetical protein [Pseudomonas sp. PDM23]
MSKFKAGDLALVIAGPCTGKCVELISFHCTGTVKLASGLWSTEITEPSWRISGEGLSAQLSNGERMPVQDGIIAERRLMPIRGDFQSEQQKEKEVEV